MSTTTVRIHEEKRDLFKIVASVEKKDIKDILTELIDEYIERHKVYFTYLPYTHYIRDYTVPSITVETRYRK